MGVGARPRKKNTSSRRALQLAKVGSTNSTRLHIYAVHSPDVLIREMLVFLQSRNLLLEYTATI